MIQDRVKYTQGKPPVGLAGRRTLKERVGPARDLAGADEIEACRCVGLPRGSQWLPLVEPNRSATNLHALAAVYPCPPPPRGGFAPLWPLGPFWGGGAPGGGPPPFFDPRQIWGPSTIATSQLATSSKSPYPPRLSGRSAAIGCGRAS